MNVIEAAMVGTSSDEEQITTFSLSKKRYKKCTVCHPVVGWRRKFNSWINLFNGGKNIGFMKALKFFNAIRMRNGMNKVVISTRIYELIVLLPAGFELMVYRDPDVIGWLAGGVTR